MDSDSQNTPQIERTLPDSFTPIDGQVFKVFIQAGLAWLRTNQQIVNSLNVFPVPDGDTGTNMVLTMQAALDEIAGLTDDNFGKIAHGVANGALMGARGNSGVILSQLWRGFARSVDNQEILDGPSFAQALAIARDTAYKGVVRPVEGTILTVAKDVAQAAEDALSETNDPIAILEQVVRAADQSVQRTPDLLPVLKEAGVVDSGGKGLFYIFEGMYRHTQGLSLDTSTATVQPLKAMELNNSLAAIEPGQDYEVVIDFRPTQELDLPGFYQNLEQMGTSIQVGEGDGIYRMHIHVPAHKRYEPIDYTMTLGTITKVAMENLVAQMEDIQKDKKPPLELTPVEPGQIAVVVVAPGEGLARVFASLGVAAIVEGGQSMNPSTKEILKAFENLPTDKIIILPNNKNVIRSAEAAKELTTKMVNVIPSKSIPQGLAATFRLAPHGDFESVTRQMTEAINEVQTGEITRATRTVEIDNVSVKKGQFIGLHNGKLVLGAASLEDACLRLLEIVQVDQYEIVTLYSGADVTQEEVEQIVHSIKSAFPNLEVEVQYGGQPHYHFIISIE